MGQLEALEPQRIGSIFRSFEPTDFRPVMRWIRRLPRSRRPAARTMIRLLYFPLTAKTKILLISGAFAVTLLGLAQAGGVLGPPAGTDRRWALSYLGSDATDLSGVSLSLLQDLAGLVILAVIFITPVFCCQQVQAIAEFVQMNERNGGAARLLDERSIRRLNDLVRKTNKWFRVLGRKRVSAPIMLAMAIGTVSLYAFVNTHGLMETWNPTALPDRVWRSNVYDAWWANWHTHPEMAIALCVAGTYAFYFLSKQLVMGVVFTSYLYRSWILGFGVTPNTEYNSDGFQGLRPLRRFMLWTYGSALAHLIGLLILFTVWLPATPWMVFLILAVMMVDMAVIVYPSSIGYHSALAAKQAYVQSLHEHHGSDENVDEAVAKVWSQPVLPVTTRKAMTGIALYLFAPAVPALFAVLFQ
ncbi:hypothetical protein OG937_44855 [Streptomyces sp. NBC_00510]